jgi:hypothetical protein
VQIACNACTRVRILSSVKALVAHPAVEALDEAILLRLAWSYVVPFDAALLLPAEDGVRGELGAVVADDHGWVTSRLRDAVEFADDPEAGE